MSTGFEQGVDLDGRLRDAKDPSLSTEKVSLREPRPSTKHDTTSPQRDQNDDDGDGGELSSVGDFPQVAVNQAEWILVRSGEATHNSSTSSTDAEREQPHQPPPDKSAYSSSGSGEDSPASFESVDATSVDQGTTPSQERLIKSPPRPAGSIDEEDEPRPKDTMPTEQQSAVQSDRNASSVSASSPKIHPASSNGTITTDEEYSLEKAEEAHDGGGSGGQHTEAHGSERSGGSQACTGSDDLPTQLTRLWGTSSPPDRADGLAAMRNMLEHRENLDAILSRLMVAKGTGMTETSTENPRPFSLEMLAERFGPAVIDPSEVRERGGARVRVVTVAGLRVGLAKRVFAREPLLPSDVEAEEEEQSRRVGDPPPPIEVESLLPLIVPAPSASAAPETSPEAPVQYPSMREVLSTMWCEEDDDSEGEEENFGSGSQGGPQSSTSRRIGGRIMQKRLRFSIQTLDGHVCDDEDEDSETEDSESEIDEEQSTDEDGHDNVGIGRRPRRSRRGVWGESKVSGGRRAGRGRNVREQDQDEIYFQRKEELASVLRRLRAAIRRMDGVLTEYEVHSTAKRIVRVAALTASTSDSVTTTAARCTLRGLGDRIQLDCRPGGGSASVRWMTIYVGVRRWGRDYFGPGFAVETQDKYRLGWLRHSNSPGAAGEEVSRNTPGSKMWNTSRGWRKRSGFMGFRRKAQTSRQEEDGRSDVEGWVGSLTCNYCKTHALERTGEFIPRYSKNDNYRDPNGDIFAEARDTEGDSVATADGNEAHTHESSLNEVGAFADQGLDPSLSTPVAVLPSAQARCGGGTVAGRAEEWCAGHVCLRLRPDGLREKSGDRGEEEDHESSDDGPESGSGSEESGEREGVDDGDRSRSRGKSERSTSPRSGDGAARGIGIPLASVTKRLFATGGRKLGDSCGVSSEQCSKSVEAFAWGDNAEGCLGLARGTSAALLPRELELHGLLPSERVVSLACSERHTLLVTSMGTIYAAGDGTDGALGLGGRENSEAFRLIEWFAERMPPPKLCQASAGSDLIGCHSAAVDVDGRLYTWGVGAASGSASLTPVLLPREMGILGGYGTAGAARDEDGLPASLSSRVASVACGGGYTLAVTNGGKVFSWGSWARGRLGLGMPPERTTRGKKRVPRFQVTPRRISGFGSAPVIQVAAGAWHGMALTEDGEVYTWGHNASGQLGFLATPSPRDQRWRGIKLQTAATGVATATTRLSDMLRSSWTPVKLPAFGDPSMYSTESPRAPVSGEGIGSEGKQEKGCVDNLRNIKRRRAVHIACGQEHSVAIDSQGAAWTWGGEGRACLGHGEAGYGGPRGGAVVAAEAQARMMGLAGGERQEKTPSSSQEQPQQQQQPSFIPLSREREVSRARARRAQADGWAVPREVVSLSSSLFSASRPAVPGSAYEECMCIAEGGGRARIVAATAGFSCTVFVADDGRMFLCGEGAAVAGGDLTTLEEKVDGTRLREGGGLVRTPKEKGDIDPLVALSAVAGPAPVPREACSSWFSSIATRRVAAVACGGNHVVALLAGDHVGYTLGMDLFRIAMGTERPHRNNDGSALPGSVRGDVDENDNGEGIVEMTGRANGWVDCELLVAGSYLYAHRVVLARRSPVLRDMIAQEERPGDNVGGSAPLQLLLPDLRFDVARALLEFIYTGELRRSLDLDSPLPYDLRAAAKSYGILRLEALCTEAIALGSDPGLGANSKEDWGQALPPPSLAGDLGVALGSMEHVDVKFIAGHRPVYAHRAVLSCGSEYFAAMFRFRDQMNDGGNGIEEEADTMPEIVVPDSYSGFVRLLLFLYTGVFPDSSPESLLEDLVSADRYRLLGMKRICQSMLRISADNCLQALHVAELVNAPILRGLALFHAEHNLAQLSQQENFHEMVLGTTGLAEVLLSRLHAASTNTLATSAAAARLKRLRNRRHQVQADGSNADRADEDPSFRTDSPFPWGAASVAVICGAINYKISNVVAVGMFVPIVNGVFFVCLAAFAFQKLKANGASDKCRGKRRQQMRGVPRKRWEARAGVKRRGRGSTYLFG